MYRYTCVFRFNGSSIQVSSEEGLHALADGFWLNKNLDLAKTTTDQRVWIPPSQIGLIEKVEIAKQKGGGA